MPTTMLAIETSCDETGVAIVRRTADAIDVLVSLVASQIAIHQATGGVVPEAAAREHVTALPVLLQNAMQESGVGKEALDAVAVTQGPGLAPALAVGVTAAQAIALAWKKPIVPVHHLEGHVYSALLQKNQLDSKFLIPDSASAFPALALIVSGGHTQLVWMPKHLTYEIIGATRDDAAGEAFDKVARLLGLPYPGGPHLSHLAAQGNPAAFAFTRPMLRSNDLDFSFSGLKTEVLYKLRSLTSSDRGRQGGVLQPKVRADIAASFEQAVVDTLTAKTAAAIKQRRPKLLLAAGGVIANTKLRRALQALAREANLPLQIAPLALCGDNAAMIGQAALFAVASRQADWPNIDIRPRWKLGEL